MRIVKTMAGSAPAAVLFVLPLLASLGFVATSALDPSAWAALWHHPQLGGAVLLSFGSASFATVLAAALALLVIAGIRPRGLSAMLAVPHLAFAIGFGFLLMPSGIVARLIAVVLTGWSSPPPWVTTHDPFGIALMLALAIKESGFLLFVLTSILAREDVQQNFAAQAQAATSLGHGTRSIWLRLYLPQLMAQMLWPLTIVFIYAFTVVDMALVLGPTQPPTLADLVWSDINSARVQDNARGGAGAVFLALIAACVICLVAVIARLVRPMVHRWWAKGPSVHHAWPAIGRPLWHGLQVIYLLVFAMLALLSLSQSWPFPLLLPPRLDGAAWQAVAHTPAPLQLSLFLAVSTSLSSLMILLLWLETVSARWDKALLGFSLAMLGLPALLIGLGQYHLFLRLGLTGTVPGLFLAHLMPVVAYMFIMLQGPARASDPRWREVAYGLRGGQLGFLTKVKWPLLKGPLLASLAVGFAVSFGQFVPAQLMAAGRFSTLPMEAVTLSSGSNRPLAAAFALLLMVPPLLVFLGAGVLGKPRWRIS